MYYEGEIRNPQDKQKILDMLESDPEGCTLVGRDTSLRPGTFVLEDSEIRLAPDVHQAFLRSCDRNNIHPIKVEELN